MLRLLLDAEAIALLIKLSHTISLWITYTITEDGGFVILFSINYCLMQLRSAEHSLSQHLAFRYPLEQQHHLHPNLFRRQLLDTIKKNTHQTLLLGDTI